MEDKVLQTVLGGILHRGTWQIHSTHPMMGKSFMEELDRYGLVVMRKEDLDERV